MTRWRRLVAALGVAVALTLPWAPGAAAAPRPALSDARVGMPQPATSPSATAKTASAGTPTSIRLTAVTPPVATPGVAVVVTGIIEPVPGRSYVDPTVRAVRPRTSLPGRSDVSAWASGAGPVSGPINGTELARVTIPGTVANGDRLTFRLELPADVLRQRAAVAAVPIALEVTGAAGSSPGPEVLRTFVGWHRAVEYTPLAVSWLVPLTLEPDPALYAADAAARSAAWQVQLGDTGRPARLVRAIQGRPVDVAVDPALVVSGATTSAPRSAAQGSSSGSAPRSTPGASQTGSVGTGSSTDSTDPVSVARVALARAITQVSAGRQVLAFPYADPDLAALAPVLAAATGPAPGNPAPATPSATPSPTPSATPSAGDPGRSRDPVRPRATGSSTTPARSGQVSPTDLTARSLVTDLLTAPDQLAATLGRSVVTGFAWPADGALPAGREETLRAAYGSGLRTILVSARQTGSTDPSPSAAATGGAGSPVLRWDDRLSELLTAAAAEPTAGALAVQEFVAQSATLLNERPSVARSVLVVAPRGLDADPGALGSFLDAVTALPWLRNTPITEVSTVGSGARATLAPATTEAPGGSGGSTGSTAGLTTAVGPSPVTGAVVGTVVGSQRTLANLATVLRPDTRLPDPWRDLGTQLLSTRWRGATDRHSETLARLSTGVSTLSQALTVSPQTTNFLADEGVLLVTVVNDLDEPVTGLRLVLTPGNARIRVVQTPDPVDIEARSKASVPVRLAAVAQGLVPLSAWLTTPSGAPVGVSSTIEVRAAPPGAWIYVASGVVLGLILLAGVVRSLRRPPTVRPDLALDPVEPIPEPPVHQPIERIHQPRPKA